MFEQFTHKNKGATAVANRESKSEGKQKSKEQSNYIREPDSALVNPRNKQQNTWEKIKNFKVEGGPNRKDILNFTKQLAIMIRAGISLQDSLESIAEQNNKEKFKAIIIDLKNRIESGESFSQALAVYPNIFSELYINMVAAAEVSGSLSKMLQKLSEYLDSEAETRSCTSCFPYRYGNTKVSVRPVSTS